MVAVVHLRLYREGVVVHDIISEGEKVVARNSGWATYRGGLLGIPSEGQRVLETGVLILRVEDGLVQEVWSEMSDLQLVTQLGAFRTERHEADESGP